MEISANTTQSQLTTQQIANKNREENKEQLTTDQSNAPIEAVDRSTTAVPVEESIYLFNDAFMTIFIFHYLIHQ